jgi:hypothetical protein
MDLNSPCLVNAVFWRPERPLLQASPKGWVRGVDKNPPGTERAVNVVGTVVALS